MISLRKWIDWFKLASNLYFYIDACSTTSYSIHSLFLYFLLYSFEFYIALVIDGVFVHAPYLNFTSWHLFSDNVLIIDYCKVVMETNGLADGCEFVEGWQFVQTLGEGTYGEVKLAVNTSTNEAVAVKILQLRDQVRPLRLFGLVFKQIMWKGTGKSNGPNHQ